MIQSDQPIPMELTEDDDAIRVRIEAPFLNTDFLSEDVGDDVVERITLERTDDAYLVTVLLGERYGMLRRNSGRSAGDPLVLDLVRTRVPTRNRNTVEWDLTEQNVDPEEGDEGDETSPDEEGLIEEGLNPDAEEIRLGPDYASNPGSTMEDLTPSPGGPSELRIITLDPGHGGPETGALGLEGSQEKDIVLQVARRFRSKLQTGLGVRVILTRDGDKELTLDERAAIANTNKSNLFVSIHADASPRRRAGDRPFTSCPTRLRGRTRRRPPRAATSTSSCGTWPRRRT